MQASGEPRVDRRNEETIWMRNEETIWTVLLDPVVAEQA